MAPQLTLDLPWLAAAPRDLGGVVLTRGRPSRVSFDDGIELSVVVLDAAEHGGVGALADHARAATGPGQVVLVAGPVPLHWRSELRDSGISWIDPTGVAEIVWPRINVSTNRAAATARAPVRRRESVALQKHRGVVAQELCIRALVSDELVALPDLAGDLAIDSSIVSRTIAELARHGFVTKQRRGREVVVAVPRPRELATLLAERTSWKRLPTLRGYLFGTTAIDIARKVSAHALHVEVDLAVTGRVGAMYFGVLGTSEPGSVVVRVRAEEHDLPAIADRLRLESVAPTEANVVLAADRWGLGANHAEIATFQGVEARVAHPLRVWCDLHDEQRGQEFAAQLWPVVVHHGS